MYKNQLQELAQRSSFNLPAYSCIREGPDHAPKFKATVNFNGEIFESPDYYPTLRQAEHAAAEVALNILSTRGPSQYLAAKVLDETGVCKNLLQETAQREGVSLPVYTTIKGGPGHVPVFSCIVEVGGRVFAGEPAKTKKQAEKNAAMAAWSVVKQLTQPASNTDCEVNASDEPEGGSSTGALALHKRDDRSQQMPSPSRFYRGRPPVRMEGNRPSREGSPAGQFQHRRGSPASSPSGQRSYEAHRFLFNQQPNARSRDLARSMGPHQRSHSLTGIDSSLLLQQEALTLNRGLASGGGYLARAPSLLQYQSRPSRLSLQSCSDRFELRRPLMEELELLEREGDNEWLKALSDSTSMHLQPQLQQSGNVWECANPHSQNRNPHSQNRRALFHSHSERFDLKSGNEWECANPHPQNRRALFHSQSERFDLKPSLLDELYQRDEEDWWLKGEMMHWERDRIGVYGGPDKGPYRFYDRSRGSFTGIEHASYPSGYSNDLSSPRSLYVSENKDVLGASFGGYGANTAGKGPFSGRDEDLGLPSSYMGFNTTSQNVSFGGDMGSSSYSSLNADALDASFFSSGGSQSLFSGYHIRAPCNNNLNDNEQASTSTSVWSCPPAQQWTSQGPTSTSSSAVAESLAVRPASSIAPPVRVRQMVAVCSAPPPRSMAVDETLTNNKATQSLYYGTHLLDCTSSIDTENSTEDLFSQLRL